MGLPPPPGIPLALGGSQTPGAKVRGMRQSTTPRVRQPLDRVRLHRRRPGRRERDASTLVVSLCRRFHLFAHQLRDRHHDRGTVRVFDEYDVQDLMHALLKLHFEDVRAEEVTPSVAGKSGRMDFLLKAERLVVETKMARRNLQEKQIGDEVIIDQRRYRSHPDLGTLVCLVYDPGGYCRAPAALENDLTGVDGRFRSVVIVCPRGT